MHEKIAQYNDKLAYEYRLQGNQFYLFILKMKKKTHWNIFVCFVCVCFFVVGNEINNNICWPNLIYLFCYFQQVQSRHFNNKNSCLKIDFSCIDGLLPDIDSIIYLHVRLCFTRWKTR